MPLPNSSYSPPKLSIEDFRGINEYLNPYNIRTSEATYCRNCNTANGALSRINGYKPFLTSALPTGIGTIIPFYAGSIKHILIASDGKLYKYNNGSFEQIASGFKSDTFDYVNFEIMSKDVVVITNGEDNVKVYDGSTIRDLKHDGRDSNDSSTNKAPKGKIMELHYGRLWIAEGNMLYFSTANRDGYDPDDWTAPVDDETEINQHGGYISLPSWDGGKIVAMKTIFNDVVVFKEKNIFKVLGTYPGEYEITQLFSSDGAIADKSVVAHNNVAYFLDNQGIFVYNGMQVDPISKPIESTIQNMNIEYAHKAVASFYRDSYFLAIPTGDSKVNNLLIEYNTIKRDFLLHEVSDITSLVEFDNKLLMSDSTGMIYELFSGDSFNGEKINSVWLTGKYDLGNKNALKSSQYLYFAGSGDGDIKVTCITERGERSTHNITLTPTEQIHRIKLKNKGRTMQLKFENIDGAMFSIARPELIVDVDFD